MLLNILALAFVAAFIVVVALGHVLLFLAIWPVQQNRPNRPTFSDAPQGVGRLPAVAQAPY